MSDDKTILQWELDAEEAGLTQHAEIIRHARRYLALRNEGFKSIREFPVVATDSAFDAAADRLLDGGE